MKSKTNKHSLHCRALANPCCLSSRSHFPSLAEPLQWLNFYCSFPSSPFPLHRPDLANRMNTGLRSPENPDGLSLPHSPPTSLPAPTSPLLIHMQDFKDSLNASSKKGKREEPPPPLHYFQSACYLIIFMIPNHISDSYSDSRFCYHIWHCSSLDGKLCSCSVLSRRGYEGLR